MAAILELQRAQAPVTEVRYHRREEFEKLLRELYEADRSSSTDIASSLSSDLSLQGLAEQLPPPEDLLDDETGAPIVNLLNALLAEAIRVSASDVHIEPYQDRLAVRYRVDGVLREVLTLDARIAPLVVSRVKVMSRLDIAEKRMPQDGRITVHSGERPVDLRVSTLPAAHGERVVMRVLDQKSALRTLDQLGLDSEHVAGLKRLIHKPNGLILVTGPTGSGKSTTLYAVLNTLNDRSSNIITVEDPIEYHLEGIGQTQVNPKVGLDFAQGLRAILRQDPDIVMVGEIRDIETAKIAMQASLTGHLVLSTLHTNTALGAIARLRDMGIESFQLAAGLSGLLAQRLVRVLCPICKQADPLHDESRARWMVPEGHEIFRAGSCDHCDFSGYQGRIGLFEFVAITDPLRELIHNQANEAEILRVARTQSTSLRDNGRGLLLAGMTSTAELARVVD